MANIVLELDLASNIYGRLDIDLKQRIQTCYDNPCQETWDDAYSVILSETGMGMTLWQAVIAVDPYFCKRKPSDGPWPKIPTQSTIRAALAYATR